MQKTVAKSDSTHDIDRVGSDEEPEQDYLIYTVETPGNTDSHVHMVDKPAETVKTMTLMTT